MRNVIMRLKCQICDPLLTATEAIALRTINLCLPKTTQITDFSTENSSQRMKLFTGHVIKVNMFERKRKQMNILRENTIM